MMKSIFRAIALTLLTTAASVSALAADYVKVSGKDGKATYFALSAQPKVTFEGSELVLTAGQETVNYPLTDVLTFEFADETAGIGSASANGGNVVFRLGSSVRGEGLQPGSRVVVYGVNGQTIGAAVADANGSVEISLSGQTGVFIVKSLTKTFKFIRK
ncbi:hypothetical protein JCM15908A_15620 [Prevotella dentasini JCM 15908]